MSTTTTLVPQTTVEKTFKTLGIGPITLIDHVNTLFLLGCDVFTPLGLFNG